MQTHRNTKLRKLQIQYLCATEGKKEIRESAKKSWELVKVCFDKITNSEPDHLCSIAEIDRKSLPIRARLAFLFYSTFEYPSSSPRTDHL